MMQANVSRCPKSSKEEVIGVAYRREIPKISDRKASKVVEGAAAFIQNLHYCPMVGEICHIFQATHFHCPEQQGVYEAWL